MTTQVLLTHHHREAMENASARGFWMPLPLPLQPQQLGAVRYLSAVSYGDRSIRTLAEISSFEPWRCANGVEQWLPFIGQLLQLPRPIPLGDRSLLSGWLPRHREQVQLVDLHDLLAAGRLSDLLSRSAASCPLPRQAAGLVMSGAAVPARPGARCAAHAAPGRRAADHRGPSHAATGQD